MNKNVENDEFDDKVDDASLLRMISMIMFMMSKLTILILIVKSVILHIICHLSSCGTVG